MRRIALLLPLLAACQEPFGTDRRDIVADRILAVSGTRDGDVVRPSAALAVDGRLWSDAPVVLSWATAASEDDALSATERREGADAELILADDDAWLSLRATFPSGTELVAVRPLASLPSPAVPSLGLARSYDSGSTLDLELADTDRARFATVAGRGTLLPQTDTRTELLLAEQTLDDGEVIATEPLSDGVLTVFALALDDDSAWRATDLWVGSAPSGLWLDDRFLPSALALPSGPHDILLTADDEAPCGLVVADVREASEVPDLALDQLLSGQRLRSELAGSWWRVDLP